MKTCLLLLPVALLSLTACTPINEFICLVESSTDAISSNRCAVEYSTTVINQNAEIIAGSTEAVKHNKALLQNVKE